MDADLAEDLDSVREQYAQLTEEDVLSFLEVHNTPSSVLSQASSDVYRCCA